MIESLVGCGVLALSVVLLNPFGVFMPDMLVIALVAIMLVAFSFFSVFIIKESARDEREVLLRMVASRYAFLLGAAILMAGITYQTFSHDVDPWLVVALASMIGAKIITRVYVDMHR